SVEGEDEPDSEWLIRRARIGIRAHVAGWIAAYVEGDFGRGTARLTDGYVDLEFDPRFELRTGQFKVPFDELEFISSRELPVIERDGLPRGAAGFTPNSLLDDLGYNSRDIGVRWSGSWDRWSAAAGVFNGSGDNEPDIDDGKQLAARLTIDLGGTWRLAGAWTGIRVSEPPDPEAVGATWYQAAELAVTAGEYAEPGWRLLGQSFVGENYDPEVLGDDDATFVALQGIASYHIPLYRTPYLIAWEPVLRLAWTRIDDAFVADPAPVDGLAVDPGEAETTLATAGVNLYWREYAVTQVQLDWLDAEPGGSDVAFRLQVGLGF
ncbi:MAG TPA: porin, partial [Gemmatimonadota bacterium]|nr:porin [Gemmatimonadota bacterium]